MGKGLAWWFNKLVLHLQHWYPCIGASLSLGCSLFNPAPLLWPERAVEDGSDPSCTPM